MMMKAKKILIVDDDASLQYIAAKRLRYFGFECHQALTVEDGLSKLARVDPDLVILDLGFTGNDGTDFLQTMRHWAAPGKAPPPVLVMSCYNSSDIIDYVLSQGAGGFLAKPCEDEDFIDRVYEFLSDGTHDAS